jgi:DNA-binding MarR family transcriptional regulator
MQYAVLAVLAANDGVDQITVAGLAALNRSTAGEVVGRLEAAGQLEHFDSDEDGRVKKLYVTRSGLRLLERVDDAIERVQERLLAPLDRAERVRFVDYLARIARENNELSRAPLRQLPREPVD